MDTKQQLKYPWIEGYVDGEPYGITIKINPTKVDEILQHLESLDITKETIYGSDHKEWDAICEEIVKNTPKL